MSKPDEDKACAIGCLVIFGGAVLIAGLNQFSQDFTKHASTGTFLLGALIGGTVGAALGAVVGFFKSLSRERMKTLDIGPLPLHRYGGTPWRVRNRYL